MESPEKRQIEVYLYHCMLASATREKFMMQNNVDIVLIEELWGVNNRIRGLRLTRDWVILKPEQPRICRIGRKTLNMWN
jgi:hypothetical protein